MVTILHVVIWSAIASCTLSAQRILFVLDGTNGTYASAQAAVDAAMDGDIVNILSLTPGNVTIANKSIWLVGRSKDVAISNLSIRDPSPRVALRISRLRFGRISELSVESKALASTTLSSVVFEDCDFETLLAFSEAYRIQTPSSIVTFQNCTFTGLGSGWNFIDPAPLMSIQNSKLVVFNSCTVKGSTGWGSGGQSPGRGGPGAMPLGSTSPFGAPTFARFERHAEE